MHRPTPFCFFDREALMDVKSVAVLPFHNYSKRVGAGVIMTNMIMAEILQHKKFYVIKYGDVRSFFLRRRITSIPTIDIETLRSLREEFRVDAVIIGSILEYEDGDKPVGTGRDKKDTISRLTISARILDTRTGRILGNGEFAEKGTAAGYLLTNKESEIAFSLAQKVAKRLISKIVADEV